jgi:hypothetical protein
MKAEQKTERVMDWLDGFMDAEEARVFEEEMAMDADLAVECGLLSELASNLREMGADLAPSDDFHRSLMARIYLEGEQAGEELAYAADDEFAASDDIAVARLMSGINSRKANWARLLRSFLKPRAMIPAAAVFCCLLVVVVYAAGSRGGGYYSSAPSMNSSGIYRGEYNIVSDSAGGSTGGSKEKYSGAGGSSGAPSSSMDYPATDGPFYPSASITADMAADSVWTNSYNEGAYPEAEDMRADEGGVADGFALEPGQAYVADSEVAVAAGSGIGTGSSTSAAPGGSGSGYGGGNGTSSQAIAERKVIRNGRMYMEVGSLDEAVAAIKFTVMRLGGYVTSEASYIVDGRERKAGAITVKVPYSQ